jgi:hypothetical protein
MKVKQNGLQWDVVDDYGTVLIKVNSNAEAWRWIERNERDPLWLKGKRANREAVEHQHYLKPH